MLNLNWSMLDADLSLTRAFTSLCEAHSPIAEGDALACSAALRAGLVMAEVIAEEDKEGDIILQIQAERLQILAVLLESGLENEADEAQVKDLGVWVKGILEEPTFSAVVGLRYPGTQGVYQPILRIVLLLLQAVSRSGGGNEGLLKASTAYTLDAADVVFDSISRLRGTEVDVETILVLGQIVGIITELTRTSTTSIWLDRIAEHNIIARSLDIITRIRIVEGYVSPHIPLILDLHLALACNTLSAEKLAISGILAAYSDNAIALEAEAGRIEVMGVTPNAHTVQGAWCGMLNVLKALLGNLPAPSTPGFIRSDVVPFMRVCTAQIQRSMGWDGDSPLSTPFVIEMSTIYDIFFNIANSIHPNESILSDYSEHALHLLVPVRHALERPNNLSGLLLPSTEDEQVGLEKEVREGDGEMKLVDFGKSPVFARKVVEILGIVRIVLGSLVVMTRAWGVLQGEEGEERDILHFEVGRSLFPFFETQG
jgi:nuclear pore complex protein Nup188